MECQKRHTLLRQSKQGAVSLLPEEKDIKLVLVGTKYYKWQDNHWGGKYYKIASLTLKKVTRVFLSYSHSRLSKYYTTKKRTIEARKYINSLKRFKRCRKVIATFNLKSLMKIPQPKSPFNWKFVQKWNYNQEKFG